MERIQVSFQDLLNRTVTIFPMGVSGIDAFGNEVLAAGSPIANVPARREQLDATEDNADRDQQTQTFRYYLPAGTAVSGRDVIVDGADTLEVIGPPDVVAGYRNEHHIELRARWIEG